MQRNIYLRTIPLPDALEKARNALDRDTLVTTETMSVADALGRVTAEAHFAKLSWPGIHSAAMDGIAVNSHTTFSAHEGEPLTLEKGRDFVPVNTGNPLPDGMDAVIKIEDVAFDGNENAQIEAPAFPWQHVRRIGEDIVATEMIVSRNHRLSPYDLGALLTGGIFTVSVFEKIKLDIIPTGDEILDYTTNPAPTNGQVIESNSILFANLARQQGVDARRIPPVPDELDKLEATVRQCLDGDAHIVVIGAGSSAGSKDFTRIIMERCGEVLVHGIAAMPGKPSLIGLAKNGKLMVGAPGYPVSGVVCMEQLVLPICAWLERKETEARKELSVHLTNKLPSRPGMEEFVRLAVGKVGERYVGTPLGRGAGLISSLTRAQAMARVPARSEGVDAGSELTAEQLPASIGPDRTMVIVGSHDNTIDLLADALMANTPAMRVASTHAGSMGGIQALKAGSALCAGAHLFDPETNDFNFPFLKRYAPDLNIRVFNLAIRHQGLIVPKGNPKGIGGVGDLKRDNVKFVNRQRGAGTRILLDHHLAMAGIKHTDVNGYGAEEFTHMAVAANVLTGAADCGLGIMAAAKALGLDFVPLAYERYDLLIPEEFMDDQRIAAVLELLGQQDFKKAIENQGGYETNLTGQEMHPGMGLVE